MNKQLILGMTILIGLVLTGMGCHPPTAWAQTKLVLVTDDGREVAIEPGHEDSIGQYEGFEDVDLASFLAVRNAVDEKVYAGRLQVCAAWHRKPPVEVKLASFSRIELGEEIVKCQPDPWGGVSCSKARKRTSYRYELWARLCVANVNENELRTIIYCMKHIGAKVITGISELGGDRKQLGDYIKLHKADYEKHFRDCVARDISRKDVVDRRQSPLSLYFTRKKI